MMCGRKDGSKDFQKYSPRDFTLWYDANISAEYSYNFLNGLYSTFSSFQDLHDQGPLQNLDSHFCLEVCHFHFWSEFLHEWLN